MMARRERDGARLAHELSMAWRVEDRQLNGVREARHSGVDTRVKGLREHPGWALRHTIE